MANKFVRAKWYNNMLKYNSDYTKKKKRVSFRVKEDTANKFKEICIKQGVSPRKMIVQELEKLL